MEALIPLLVLGAIVMAPLIWFIGTYNGLVRLRNHTAEAWSGIDTELKRRYDLIPNLVATVKGYARHEQEIFRAVTEARAKAVASTGTPAQQAADENLLIGSLRSLLAVVENYPDLKASDQYLRLQDELINTEDRIQAARRFYNANVRDLNNRCEVIPSNIVASLFNFRKAEFFEIESACERSNPTVSI